MPHRTRDTVVVVIAGLDPAIHPLRRALARWMDTRVKPAYDAECVSRTLRKFPNSNFKQPSACILAPPRKLGF
jgi:hypothetical protein